MTKPRWQTKTAAPLSTRFALAGDGVVIPTYKPATGDRLSCFGLDDGAERWQVDLPSFVLANALASVKIAPAGDAVVLAQVAQVASYAAADGATRWDVAVPGESFSIAHPPQVDGDRVYLLSRSSRVVAVGLADGALAFTTGDHEPALDLAVRGGAVITRSLETPDVRAFDAATGAPLWQRTMSGPWAITTRLVQSIAMATRDYLVLDGERALLSLDPKTGAIRWEEPVVGLASYAFAGAVVIVSDAASVRGIDASTGAVHWRQPTGGRSLVAPLDESRALLALAPAVCTVDVGGGAIVEHARHLLAEQDHVLDARDGGVVVTTDNGVARSYRSDGRGLHEVTIGETAARPDEPAAHGVLQAAIAGRTVVTFNSAHELARFDA